VSTIPRDLEAIVVWHDGLVVTASDEKQLQRALKRMLDICGSLVLLALLTIPALIVSIVIKLDSRGPVLIWQWRTGRYGRPFRMVKFRTMCDRAEDMKRELHGRNEAQGPLFKMKDDPRMTRVGRWLRKTSIDEMPQLVNVQLGEMSLVGPRPPLPSEVRLYSTHQLRRLGTKPGMTGLWQVSGRSTLTFGEMVELDVHYIRTWSFTGDLVILAKTVPAVISTRGAY